MTAGNGSLWSCLSLCLRRTCFIGGEGNTVVGAVGNPGNPLVESVGQ